MKQDRIYTKINITPKGENSILAGHPWIYDAEITKINGEYINGDLVDVLNSKDK
ncbi:MAG: rlmI, partial [Clostridia bacterium]|nr:rlmI [Clostridia bacterium]